MKKDFPVYDICQFSYSQEEEIIVKPFGDYLKSMRKLHFPHRHDFYHIVLFTKGSGSHSIDFEKFNVQPFHVYFMAPGQIHGWDFEGEVDGYVINFSVGFFKSFLLNAQYLEQFPFLSGNVNYSAVEIELEEQANVLAIMEKAVQEEMEQARFKQDMLRLLLLEFFLLIARANNDATETKSPESHNRATLRSFEKLIEQHYLHHRLPKHYAGLLFVSPNHLNAVCKGLLGVSAGDMIRNRIVLEAKRMLANLDLTVTEIAYSLNFEDNSYFCKFFKNQAGVSPDAFRKGL